MSKNYEVVPLSSSFCWRKTARQTQRRKTMYLDIYNLWCHSGLHAITQHCKKFFWIARSVRGYFLAATNQNIVFFTIPEKIKNKKQCRRKIIFYVALKIKLSQVFNWFQLYDIATASEFYWICRLAWKLCWKLETVDHKIKYPRGGKNRSRRL
jgi:hypothetical protein